MITPRIVNVIALKNFILEIEYENGETRLYDMKKQLKNNYYKDLNNIGYFLLAKSVQTTIEWPNGEDIDPNELYKNSVIK